VRAGSSAHLQRSRRDRSRVPEKTPSRPHRSLKAQQRTGGAPYRSRTSAWATRSTLSRRTVIPDDRPKPGIDGHSTCRGEPRLPRKEVIQPQLPLRLPCYDFTPIIDPTFDGCLPEGLAHRLRVLPTFVV
jgi:hypothetical protein